MSTLTLTTDLFNQLISQSDLNNIFNLTNLNVQDKRDYGKFTSPMARAQAYLNNTDSNDPHIVLALSNIKKISDAVGSAVSISQNLGTSLITALSTTIPSLITTNNNNIINIQSQFQNSTLNKITDITQNIINSESAIASQNSALSTTLSTNQTQTQDSLNLLTTQLNTFKTDMIISIPIILLVIIGSRFI